MVPDPFLTFCLRHGCGLMPSDGLTLQEIDGYGTTDSATTEYFYDHANGLTKVIDPEGNSTNYVLNADGQSVSVTLDLSTGLSSEAFSYNLANQLVQTVDGDGRTDTYVNNADGLVTSESAGGRRRRCRCRSGRRCLSATTWPATKPRSAIPSAASNRSATTPTAT